MHMSAMRAFSYMLARVHASAVAFRTYGDFDWNRQGRISPDSIFFLSSLAEKQHACSFVRVRKQPTECMALPLEHESQKAWTASQRRLSDFHRGNESRLRHGILDFSHVPAYGGMPTVMLRNVVYIVFLLGGDGRGKLLTGCRHVEP